VHDFDEATTSWPGPLEIGASRCGRAEAIKGRASSLKVMTND